MAANWVNSTSDPQTSNNSSTQYVDNETRWRNTSTGDVFICVDAGAGTWEKIHDESVSDTEMDLTDGVTAGTGLASKVMTLDSSGDYFHPDTGGIVVGHTAQERISTGDGATDLVPEVQVLGTAQADSSLMLACFNATDTVAATLAFVKSGDAALDGTHTAVADNEYLGRIIAFGDDGTDLESPAAEIRFVVDDTVATGQMGGSIEMFTTADGGETLTKALTIDVAQGVTVVGNLQATGANMEATAGAGITGGADSFASSVQKFGTLFKTTIVIDIDGLNSGGTAADIIGQADTANCALGQITAARNGTIFAGRLTCLEATAGGDDDIDLYSGDLATGTEDANIDTADSGTADQLCNSGDLVAGTIVPLTAFPAADNYLYLVAGTGDTDATYTAGILIIELWGK